VEGSPWTKKKIQDGDKMTSYADLRDGLKDDDGEPIKCALCGDTVGTNFECHNCIYTLYAHLERNRVLRDSIDPDKLTKAFEDLHKKGAKDFGMYWLKVNRVMVDAASDIVRYTEMPTKYILTKIAYAVCEMMQQEVDDVADRLEGKKEEPT
jgi:hypothetical protein